MKPSPRFWLKHILLVWVAVFFVTVFSHSASAQDCTTITDADLVTGIVDQIKGDSVLSPQMSHIVVGSVNKFVKLQGWTDTKRAFDRLIQIVSDTKCVKAINVNNFVETPPPANSPMRPAPGGCGPGTKACGDVCIPEGDSCSDKGKVAS